ncbi:hypothetical protein, partial [Azospirillum sp. TSO22-1]|uniref:hypothetical protein n=1 Tax=Azospirillum sp. TSO22-1 TaxID=716789 RepID=UPI001B3B7A06
RIKRQSGFPDLPFSGRSDRPLCADSVEKLPGECFAADSTQQCVALPAPEAISLSDMVMTRQKISRPAGPGSFSTLSATS